MTLEQRIHQLIAAPLAQVEQLLHDILSRAEGLGAVTSLHLLKAGGKRIRPTIVLLSGRLFSAPEAALVPIAAASEMIHMATLVHDDVIDRADTRRGRPTVNALWGNHPAVLTGDLLLARAMSLIVDQGHPRVLKVMADMVYEMCEGEIAQHETRGYQAGWRGDGSDGEGQRESSIRDYFRRIGKKSARFFEACARSGALLGGAPEPAVERIGRFGFRLGMLFQVIDDLLDITGEKAALGKPVGSDLADGVLTLPVLYLLEHPEYQQRASSLLRCMPPGPAEIQAMITLVRENGALRYTQSVAEQFAGQAIEALSALPDGEPRQLLQAITEQLLVRRN